MSTCARAPGGIDYRHLRKLSCVIIRMSGSGSLVCNQGRSKIPGRRLEGIAFDQNAVNFSRRINCVSPKFANFEARASITRISIESIKEKSLHRNNRMFGFMDAKDQFVTCLNCVSSLIANFYKMDIKNIKNINENNFISNKLLTILDFCRKIYCFSIIFIHSKK